MIINFIILGQVFSFHLSFNSFFNHFEQTATQKKNSMPKYLYVQKFTENKNELILTSFTSSTNNNEYLVTVKSQK